MLHATPVSWGPSCALGEPCNSLHQRSYGRLGPAACAESLTDGVVSFSRGRRRGDVASFLSVWSTEPQRGTGMGLPHHTGPAALATPALAFAAAPGANRTRNANHRVVAREGTGSARAVRVDIGRDRSGLRGRRRGAMADHVPARLERRPAAAREPSHPHVATLRADGRRRSSGSVVAFLDGLAEPVHIAVFRDAPAAPRVRIGIAGRVAGSGGARRSADCPPDRVRAVKGAARMEEHGR